MTAGDRTREAVVLLAVLCSLWAGLDAFGAVGRTEAGRRRLASALAAGLAGASLVAFLERLGVLPLTAERWAGLGRLSGSASDPNALGLVVTLGAPLLVGILSARTNRAAVVAAGLALLLLGPVLEGSGSRTGLLLLGASAVAGGVGLARQGARGRRLVLGAAAAAVAALALVVALAPRGKEPSRGGLLARVGASLSAPSTALLTSHRPMFWGAAFDMLAAEPLSGVGLGGFPFEFPAVHERRAGAPPPATDNATNLLLDVAAESGLPALLLALGAVVPLLSRALGAACGKGAGDPLGRAAGTALAGFAVASLTGSHLRFPEVAVLAAGLAALLPAPVAGMPAGEGLPRPRRVLPVLAASGVLAALLSTLSTARPDAAFRGERWAGVHDRGRPRRWTSANAFRAVAPGERRLALTMANERPDRRPVVMRVRVDDAPAGALAIPPGPPRRYRVDLPGGARVVRFTFEPVFVPRALPGGTDGRTLGVRLHADGGERP
jgi:O-antigen ligase